MLVSVLPECLAAETKDPRCPARPPSATRRAHRTPLTGSEPVMLYINPLKAPRGLLARGCSDRGSLMSTRALRLFSTILLGLAACWIGPESWEDWQAKNGTFDTDGVEGDVDTDVDANVDTVDDDGDGTDTDTDTDTDGDDSHSARHGGRARVGFAENVPRSAGSRALPRSGLALINTSTMSPSWSRAADSCASKLSPTVRCPSSASALLMDHSSIASSVQSSPDASFQASATGAGAERREALGEPASPGAGAG